MAVEQVSADPASILAYLKDYAVAAAVLVGFWFNARECRVYTARLARGWMATARVAVLLAPMDKAAAMKILDDAEKDISGKRKSAD